MFAKRALPFYISTSEGCLRAPVSSDPPALFDSSHLNGCEVPFHCGFDLHFSLTAVDAEHFFMLLAICISLKKCLFWTHF